MVVMPQETRAPVPRQHFAALHAARGICAVLVMVYHLPFYSHALDVELVKHAWLCVDFFFVLSGFVIAAAYGDRLRSGTDLRVFIIRRIGRLWPLHATVLAVCVAYVLALLLMTRFGTLMPERALLDHPGAASPYALLTNITLVQALGLHSDSTWNGPAWSISAEAWTYLLFALLCIYFRKWLTFYLVIFASIGCAVVWILSPRYLDTIADYAIFRCIYGFSVGALTHRLWRTMRPLTSAWLTLWELAATVLAIAFLTSASFTPLSMAAPLVFAVVVLGFAFNGGALSRHLDRPAWHRLGDLSYSIYMNHFIIILLVDRLLRRVAKHVAHIDYYSISFGDVTYYYHGFGSIWLMDVLAALTVITVWLSAHVTYNLVEKPSRIYFNRLALRPRAARRPVPLGPRDLGLS